MVGSQHSAFRTGALGRSFRIFRLFAAWMQAARTRLTIAPDTLRIDRWRGDSWDAVLRWPGPLAHGVTLEVSNPEVVFDPIGLGWGVSNTSVVMRRGSRIETLTVSRV